MSSTALIVIGNIGKLVQKAVSKKYVDRFGKHLCYPTRDTGVDPKVGFLIFG